MNIDCRGHSMHTPHIERALESNIKIWKKIFADRPEDLASIFSNIFYGESSCFECGESPSFTTSDQGETFLAETEQGVFMSLQTAIDLHASFNNKYGIGDNLIHYLAQPKTHHNGFDFEVSVKTFETRQAPRFLDSINAAGHDVYVMRKRFNFLANDNDAYRIASSHNPSVEELITFSYMLPGWSILFPLKHYLFHHWDKAVKYTGFLPFGAPVIAFVNTLETRPKDVVTSPDYADHVYLQNISNEEARINGVPSIEINNRMYLAGKRLTGKKVVPPVEEKVQISS